MEIFKLNKYRILLDCDGILADFVTPTLNLIESATGDKHTIDEIVFFDIFGALNKKDLEYLLKDAVEQSGWCFNMQILPGAFYAVNNLQELGELFIVTSPFKTKNWHWERTQWLLKHFPIQHQQISFTSSKQIVKGDALLDDGLKNVVAWKREFPEGLAMIWDYPWNREKCDEDIVRVHNWDEVQVEIKKHKLKVEK